VRVLRMLMHLSSGHVTLLQREFPLPLQFFPNRTYGSGRTHVGLCPKFLVSLSVILFCQSNFCAFVLQVVCVRRTWTTVSESRVKTMVHAMISTTGSAAAVCPGSRENFALKSSTLTTITLQTPTLLSRLPCSANP